MNLVIIKETDIGLGGISIDSERAQVVDFVDPYHNSPVTFVTKAPEMIDNSTIMFLILKKELWIALILTVGALSLFARVLRINYQIFNYFHPVIRQSML